MVVKFVLGSWIIFCDLGRYFQLYTRSLFTFCYKKSYQNIRSQKLSNKSRKLPNKHLIQDEYASSDASTSAATDGKHTTKPLP